VSSRPSDATARAAACAAIVGLSVLGWPSDRPAAASVSIPVTFDDLVGRATAAAIVMPIEQHGVWEDGRIATYTHLRIERRVAGTLPESVWVRTEGGAVGHVGQIVEGEAAFVPGTPSLVFLHPRRDGGSATAFGVVEGAQGQFPIVTEGRRSPRLVMSPHMGGLVPPASTSPLARDVLVDVALEDAAKAIAAAWAHRHSRREAAP
jgi:hypothetical protein